MPMSWHEERTEQLHMSSYNAFFNVGYERSASGSTATTSQLAGTYITQDYGLKETHPKIFDPPQPNHFCLCKTLQSGRAFEKVASLPRDELQ